MIQEYLLKVKVKNTPYLKKQCNRCHNTSVYCSDRFRINAQKKSIDVWLIYNCTKCDKSYNATIISRSKPELITKDLFDQFLENDIDTAWRYAFSKEIAKINSLEFDFGSVEYDIVYQGESFATLTSNQHDKLIFKINYPFDFNLKISTIIRGEFGFSSNQMVLLIEEKVISVDSRFLQKKDKLRDGLIIEIDVLQIKGISNL